MRLFTKRKKCKISFCYSPPQASYSKVCQRGQPFISFEKRYANGGRGEGLGVSRVGGVRHGREGTGRRVEKFFSGRAKICCTSLLKRCKLRESSQPADARGVACQAWGQRISRLYNSDETSSSYGSPQGFVGLPCRVSCASPCTPNREHGHSLAGRLHHAVEHGLSHGGAIVFAG